MKNNSEGRGAIATYHRIRRGNGFQVKIFKYPRRRGKIFGGGRGGGGEQMPPVAPYTRK